MAVITVDNRVVISDADSTTGWTGVGGGTTTTPRAEGTFALAEAYNIATGTMYFSPTPNTNLTNRLLYVQSYTNALQNGWKEATLSNSSHMLYIEDNGNNELALCQAGDDRDVFKHSKTQVQFQCFLIDLDFLSTKNTNGEVLAIAGSVASFNEASITRIGSRFVTLSKALGGGDNCFIDILRYDEVDSDGNTTTSNSGISIYGGGTGTEGKFSEIVTEDESNAADKGHGVIREYTAGSYGVQGILKFGTTNALGNAIFDDSDFTITFENRDVNDDKYGLYVFGNSTNTNNFTISNGTITTAGPGVVIDMSSTNIDVLNIDNVNFNNLLNAVTFPTDVANSGSHSITNSTFTNVGTIATGTVTFNDNTVLSSNATTNAVTILNDISSLNLLINGYEGTAGTGALLWNAAFNPVGNIDGSAFIKGTASTHAIEFGTNTPTTFNLTDLTFTGYDTTNGETTATDAVLYFPDTGTNVTWTVGVSDVTGTISYRKARVGDVVDIQNNVSVTVTGLKDDTEVRVLSTDVPGVELAGVETATDGTTDDRSFTFSLSAGLNVIVVVHSLGWVYIRQPFTIPASAGTLPIQQQLDRVYSNP